MVSCGIKNTGAPGSSLQTSTRIYQQCLAASNVKLTRTVRAKWRELGDPGKRGDDIHDVNGTGPVAAEHQHCHNLPLLPHLSHPSLSGIRKLQVASALSLKPEVYVMP